ncbi:hypothetical protein V6N11_033926 [Hibiscus sabdariffa]|uniref:Uncharacterized protein n=1 Tax=Hibiscus sabdariffa TaxID=183260 RepID=A0ABR2S0Y1_9ROSI
MAAASVNDGRDEKGDVVERVDSIVAGVGLDDNAGRNVGNMVHGGTEGVQMRPGPKSPKKRSNGGTMSHVDQQVGLMVQVREVVSEVGSGVAKEGL